jgi:rod shape-determining protein MreC
MGGFLPPAERRSSVLLGVYAALSLLLLMAGDRLPGSALRGFGAWLFAPLDRVVLIVDRVAAAWRENRQLHERVVNLELENRRLRTAGVENQQLRRYLDLPPWQGVALTPAEILSLSGEPQPTAATLSAGTRHGVHPGDVVLTDDGLLGRLEEVWGSLSRAELLTDPNSAVACEIESTGVLGVLRPVSLPRPRLVLTGVPLSDTVLVGQVLLTSGMSSRYPRGLRVGIVERVARERGELTQDIEVRPAARLSRLRHAFVLSRAPGTEDP